MISKRIILVAVLFTYAALANAQLSVDVFYGYNHSNREHSMPVQYDGINRKCFYTNQIDTIYRPDSTFYPYRNVRYIIDQSNTTRCNFASQQNFGLSLNYRFVNYFRVGLSFEKIVYWAKEPRIEVLKTEDFYDEDDISFQNQFRTDKLNYDITTGTVHLAFLYPYRKFAISANFGLSGYYTTLKSSVFYQYNSLNHAVFNTTALTITQSLQYKYQGYTMGYSAGVGVSYILYKNLSAFVNIGYTWASLAFQKGERYDYHYMNINSQGETRYNTELLPQEIAPEDIPFGKINFNSTNIRLGLSYTFGKK
ncbi:MAG TPA: hypothetical protein PLZ52_08170 [Bacteroidales bacterium]|nr:hypothetical protein [Bacteroidales bacterium]